MQRTAEKPHQNGHAEKRRKQDVFYKLLQADDSALCGTIIHPAESGVSQAGEKRFRNGLFQADEQLGVWEDDGKLEKPRWREDSERLGK